MESLTDLYIETFKKERGVERCRLYNKVFDCFYEVGSPTRNGTPWKMSLRSDDYTEAVDLSGTAPNRALAGAMAIDEITRAVRATLQNRESRLYRARISRRLSRDAGVPLADG